MRNGFTEWVSRVSKQTGVKRSDCHLILRVAIDELKNMILEHKYVNIYRLGIFRFSVRPARRCYDINVGKVVLFPAKYILKFTPTSLFANAIGETEVSKDDAVNRKVRIDG